MQPNSLHRYTLLKYVKIWPPPRFCLITDRGNYDMNSLDLVGILAGNFFPDAARLSVSGLVQNPMESLRQQSIDANGASTEVGPTKKPHDGKPTLWIE